MQLKEADLATVQTLLNNPNIDVNAQNKHGSTALHLIVQYKPIEHLENEFKYDDEEQEKITTALIQAGADLNIQGICGDTPLLVALDEQRPEIAQILIAAGANHNIQNDYGEVPLIRAIQRQYSNVVQALIKAGSKINTWDKYEETPRHHAAREDKIEIVLALITQGANINASTCTLRPSQFAQNPQTRQMLELSEINLQKTTENPSIEEEELNESFTKAGLKFTVPKDAYFKMLYHGAPIKLKNND